MEPINRDAVSIPFFVHEGDMDRMERTNKRLSIALIVAVILMFVTNCIWLYEWMQYDYCDEETVTTSYEQDGSGINVMGSHNEVSNGTANNSDSDKAEDENEIPEIVPSN